MRLFPVPMSVTEEEKLIGGYFSVRQMVYMIAAAVISMAAFFILPFNIFFRIIFVIPILLVGFLLVVPGDYMPYGIDLDKLIVLAVKYKFRKKKFYA